MHRTGLLKIALTCLLVLVGFVFVAPDASAQALVRDGIFYIDGEPTDPEDVNQLLGESGIDHDDPPTDEAEFLNWFEQLVNLLKTLGLYPPGEPGP